MIWANSLTRPAGNGLPDEMWYEVKGSDDGHETYKNLILRRYAVTYIKSRDEPGITNEYGQIVRTICWMDSRGRVGAGPVGNEKGITGVAGTWITYTGTLLRDGGDNINNRASIFERGYVDIYHNEDIQTCFVLLANTIRADRTPASLSSIRFVKARTAYFEYDTPSGDISTEIVRSDPGFIDQSGGFPNPLGSMR